MGMGMGLEKGIEGIIRSFRFWKCKSFHRQDYRNGYVCGTRGNRLRTPRLVCTMKESRSDAVVSIPARKLVYRAGAR